MKYSCLVTIILSLSFSCSQNINDVRSELEIHLKECTELLEQGKRQDLLIQINEVKKKYESSPIWQEYSEKFDEIKPMKSRLKDHTRVPVEELGDELGDR